jgi:Uncharacterized protein conserved in bacteria
MRHPLRTIVGAALCAFSTLAIGTGHAQNNYPSKPVKIIVGLGAGSSADIVARTVATGLSEKWGQPVVVENRVGAAGNIAADQVSRSNDDHTLLLAQNAIAISASLYDNLSYDLRKDLKPVTQLTAMPHVLVVGQSVPANTLKEFLDLARAKPGALNFSSAGIGNADHMAAELLVTKAGVKMLHVPYTGGSQALNAAAAGDVQMYFPGLPVSMPLIKAGKVKALAVTSKQRSPALPDVPTVEEAGLPGYDTVLWYGLFAPKGVDDATLEKIARDVADVLARPDIKQKYEPNGIALVGSTPAEFKKFVDSEIDRWAAVVKAGNLKPN